MSKQLITKIREFVIPIYNAKTMEYHNMIHAEQVMSVAKKLAKKEGLPKEKIEELKIAALFHDVGYNENPDQHEEISAEIAESFLESHKISQKTIDNVKRLILATKVDVEPQMIDEMIIKDADVAHVGTLGFINSSDGLRAEIGHLIGKQYTDEEWLNINLDFLEEHRFYTQSAKSMFEKLKASNIKTLKKENRSYEKDKGGGSTDRGIETMFRVALRNHNNLSQIADNKANIMLSVNTIMLSLLLSTLVPKVDSNPTLIIPTIITLIVCLVTMYFAIMATRPKIFKTSNYSRELLQGNKTNLLFFGNFQTLDLEEFEWGIGELMKDRELLYGALTKDLYFLGIVLGKKYSFLNKCYNVFMVGLLVSAVSFIVAMVF